MSDDHEMLILDEERLTVGSPQVVFKFLGVLSSMGQFI
jgi:hypothetical protein